MAKKFDIPNMMILPKRQDNRGFPAVADGEFDKDLLAALEEKFLPKPRPDTSNLTWTSKDRRKTPISEMVTRHLINTIRMIEDGRHATVKEDDPLHQALRADLEWRKAVTKKFSKERKVKRRSTGGVFFEEDE